MAEAKASRLTNFLPMTGPLVSLPMTSPLEITGLAEIAAQLPDADWYELRIVFRRVPSGAEVRADKTIRRAEIVPGEISDE